MIGYGSIGRKHGKIIESFGDHVEVLTKSHDCSYSRVENISELLRKDPERIIIANETAHHLSAYREIRAINSKIPVLIEKPLFDNVTDITGDLNTFVAYCLRFHPLVEKLKTLIGNDKIISAHYYVGQFLPSWRPDRDYRETYSAKKALGGGVMRDLSHELDLAAYFHGELEVNFVKKFKLSALEIDSDDSFTGVFSSAECPLITVQLNYLDRITQRNFTLISDVNTYKVDFISGEIRVNEQLQVETPQKDKMYKSMLKNFRDGQFNQLTKFDEGNKILEIFKATEDKK